MRSFGVSNVPEAAVQRALGFVLTIVIGKIQGSNFTLIMEESVLGRIRACVLKGKGDKSNLTVVTIPRAKRYLRLYRCILMLFDFLHSYCVLALEVG